MPGTLSNFSLINLLIVIHKKYEIKAANPYPTTDFNKTFSKITVDANHPFANFNLTWEAMVLSMRDASSGELQSGKVGGMQSVDPGCCDGEESCSIHKPEPVVEKPKSEGGCCGSC